MQAMLGLNPGWRLLNDVQGIEQEATCLEGVYIADAAARGLIGEATIGDMLGMFNGDEEHGTSEQLVAAFTAGFDDGFAGCGVGLPDADATSSGTIATTAETADRDAVTGDAPSVSIAPGSTVRVTTAGVNLRTAPSTDAAVRTTLGLDRDLLVTGASVERGGYDWWPVADEATGETGFVAGAFLVVEA